jgi:hypothetical protein
LWRRWLIFVTQARRFRLYTHILYIARHPPTLDSIKSAHTTPLLRSIWGLLATGYEPGVRSSALGDLHCNTYNPVGQINDFWTLFMDATFRRQTH